ncbi:30S ribosomal protein S3 [Candidatus Halobonum tyrrellensis]|uniref:Small ribosomal subunit protein uS3 n=1 Tax=Candidatus Halobonum tyrrellensis G22 TaxID=1324957 RepID=V4HFN7_9EURY|nr:30S ribosomal protein S3 [Candidatus Halobonum tyrrellensis]ESP88898.1 30S ribosomal protein S3P [Candidatus Halobonum tyrrellensis G22]
MADEHQFIEDGLQRSQIDEFFENELGRAGYGGMDVAKTPMGTQIVLKAEKPGMVIGKGGKNIRKVTTELEERFDMDDPQIDVQEVDEPDLNAKIVADRLANALERGWYFRKAGHTTIDRIMDAGALGAEINLNGKVTGARSRDEKFNRGYIKHNGEPAQDVVDTGQGVAVMKLGTIGVTVKIIPPGAELPDDFEVADDAEAPEVEQTVEDDGVEALLEEEPEEVPDVGDDEDVEVPTDEPDDVDVIDEDVVEEVIESDETEDGDGAADTGEPSGESAADAEEMEDLDEDVESEAEELVAEMESDEDDSDDEEETASDDSGDEDEAASDDEDEEEEE